MDDWEGHIAKNQCWSSIRESVDILFLSDPFVKTPESVLSNVAFLMAIRERTALTILRKG